MNLFLRSIVIIIFAHSLAFAQTDSSDAKFYKKPEIGLGYGISKFSGEVGHEDLFNFPLGLNNYYSFYFRLPLSKSFGLDYNFYYDYITVEQGLGVFSNYNFQTHLISQNLNLSYSLRRMIYKDNYNPFVYPVLHFGVEVFKFDSFGDLFDNSGNLYHYWSDGTIRNISELSPIADQANVIQRDGIYETNLRAQDNDQLGNYAQIGVAFPVTLDLKFKVYKKTHLTITASYHMLQTDLIDDISLNGLGDRKGDADFDNLLYTGVRLTYDFGAKETPKSERNELDKKEQQLAKKEAKRQRKEAKKALKLAKKKQKEEEKLASQQKRKEEKEETVDSIDNDPIVENENSIEKEDKREIVAVEENTNYKIYIKKYNNGVPVLEMNTLLLMKGIETKKNSDGSVEFTAGTWNRVEAERNLESIKEKGFKGAYIISGDEKTFSSDSSESLSNQVNEMGSSFEQNSSAESAPNADSYDMSGVEFKVQIAAYKDEVSSSKFSNVDNLSKEKLDNGIVRYYSGMYTDYNRALEHSSEMNEAGYDGAFVVAYKDGKRVSLSELGLGAARKVTPPKEKKKEELNSDIVFKVQLGAFREDVPFELLQKFTKVEDMNQSVTPEGLTRYTAGEYATYEEAKKKKQEVLDLDIEGVFIISFYKGRLIPVSEAIELMK